MFCVCMSQVSVFAHELAEAVTDSQGAWFEDRTNEEVADLCAWQFGLDQLNESVPNQPYGPAGGLSKAVSIVPSTADNYQIPSHLSVHMDNNGHIENNRFEIQTVESPKNSNILLGRKRFLVQELFQQNIGCVMYKR